MGWERIFSLPAKWRSHPEVFRSVWRSFFFWGVPSGVCKSHPARKKSSFSVVLFMEEQSRAVGGKNVATEGGVAGQLGRTEWNMKSFFKFCNAAFCHQRSGITLVNNPWRPPATVFILPRFPPWSHFELLIHDQSSGSSWREYWTQSPGIFVSIGVAQTRRHTRAAMITGSKGGSSLPVRLFVAPYLSSFGKHLVGNLWGPAPEDLREIPARLRFWLLCWPSN